MTHPKLACLAALALAAPVHELSAADAAPPSFEVSTDLVELDVSVREPDGRPVAGLGLPDLAVYEDGVPQACRFLQWEEEPLSVVLMVDASASLGPQFEALRQAGRQFVRSLRPQDQVELRAFSARSAVLEDMTADHAQVLRAIDALRADGDTGLHDAVYIALSDHRWQATAPAGRRPIAVLLTDGRDTRSLLTDDQVIRRARERRALSIFSVGLLGAPDPLTSRARFLLRALSDESGGRAYFPVDRRDLERTLGSLRSEVTGRYRLGYVPTNQRQDGAWRRVSVRVPERPALQVRCRTGYFASRERGPRLVSAAR
jgi:Ca-activated chloride channel family protein